MFKMIIQLITQQDEQQKIEEIVIGKNRANLAILKKATVHFVGTVAFFRIGCFLIRF